MSLLEEPFVRQPSLLPWWPIANLSHPRGHCNVNFLGVGLSSGSPATYKAEIQGYPTKKFKLLPNRSAAPRGRDCRDN